MATKIFYKYKTINKYTKDSLKKGYFWLADPDSLNDPFEALCKHIYDASDNEKINWWENRQINTIKGNPKYAAKIDILSEKIKQIPNEKKLKEVNDAIEKHNFEKIELKYRNRFGILSLAEECDDIRMWSYYADSHKGICIGYEVQEAKNSHTIEVTECEKYEKYLVEGNRAILNKVEYERTRSTYNPIKGDVEGFTEFVMKKTSDWEFEKEHRIVILSEDLLKEDFRKMKYARNVLKEIIFGCKAEDKAIEEIKELVIANYSNEIKFYKMELDLIGLRLEKTPI